MSLALVNLMVAMSIAENRMGVQTIQANDSLGGTPSYSIAGGADASAFVIDSVTGALTFATPPDYDVPVDADENNVYEVEVTASSTSGAEPVTQALTVSITAANDALEKSLDLARVAGEKIARESVINDEQNQSIADLGSDVESLGQTVGTKAAQADVESLSQTVGTKAAQADVDTLSNTVASKASQAEVNNVAVVVGQNANRVGNIESYFNGNNVIGLEHLPEQLRTGMKPLGAFAVGVDTLPAATDENEWQYYIADGHGSVDLSAAQDGSRIVEVAPKGWIMSTGLDTGWRYMSGGDGLTTVNGKTAENGSVVIKAEDTPYVPSEASGLSATSAKAGLDEVGVKIADTVASIGDVGNYDPVTEFNRSYAERLAQG